jgi:glyoxylase-like metal-dependent hydrolase (beta-lactamase superfamily II)
MTRLTSPQQLSPHLYIVYSEYPHRDSSNVYLITGHTNTLIDCGSLRSVPLMLSNLAQLGLDIHDIDRIIATHGDCDHTQGFCELQRRHPDLRLHLHPADWSLVQDANPYRNAGYLYRIVFQPISPEMCIPIADGDRIGAGDGELTVVHTPGHTEGGICLWGEIDGKHVLFAGDTVGGSMRSLQGADLKIWAEAAETWKESLKRIVRLEIDWILNGHEPARSLPLPRTWLDRGITTFGQMLSPWFFLHEGNDDNGESAPEAVTSVPVDTPAGED